MGCDSVPSALVGSCRANDAGEICRCELFRAYDGVRVPLLSLDSVGVFHREEMQKIKTCGALVVTPSTLVSVAWTFLVHGDIGTGSMSYRRLVAALVGSLSHAEKGYRALSNESPPFSIISGSISHEFGLETESRGTQANSNSLVCRFTFFLSLKTH